VNQLALSVTSGGVDNMETYKYIIGQINALESVRQEIISLLTDKEENENNAEQSSTSKRSQKLKQHLLDKYKEEPVKEITTETTKLTYAYGLENVSSTFQNEREN
jgi:hypothetical protein